MALGIRQDTLETTGRGPRQHPRGISTRTSGQETYNPYHSDLEERAQKDTPRPNRRQTRIQNLRRELRLFRRRYHDSSPTERVGLTQLRATLRSQLTSLRKSENTRRKTRERAKKGAAFTANPYKFARSLLDKERSGKLETPLEEVEKYLHVTHSDPHREDALGDCD